MVTDNNPFRYDLMEDEEVLWTGKPETSVIFTTADILLIPISLWFGIYAIYNGFLFLSLSLNPNYDIVLAVLSAFGGLAFIFMGFYLTIGRFIYKIWRKQHTTYAVTNKRVLVKVGHRRVKEQAISEIPLLRKQVYRSGTGTVTFGRSPFAAVWCGNTGMNCLVGFDTSEMIAFHDIKHADNVYALVDWIKHKQEEPADQDD
jgi:hypothetical protein